MYALKLLNASLSRLPQYTASNTPDGCPRGAQVLLAIVYVFGWKILSQCSLACTSGAFEDLEATAELVDRVTNLGGKAEEAYWVLLGVCESIALVLEWLAHRVA